MSKAAELKGQRFGRLLVVGRAEAPTGKEKWGGRFWKCVCSCGESRVVASNDLMNDRVRSCGCMTKENRKQESRYFYRRAGMLAIQRIKNLSDPTKG